MIYLDSSALVKLAIMERESESLRRHLPADALLASCALARVEVVRAVRHRGAESIGRARAVVELVNLIDVRSPLLDAAADLEDERLRSLDAIHVAAALSLGEGLAQLITYDRRMTEAAGSLGLPVAAPT